MLLVIKNPQVIFIPIYLRNLFLGQGTSVCKRYMSNIYIYIKTWNLLKDSSGSVLSLLEYVSLKVTIIIVVSKIFRIGIA